MRAPLPGRGCVEQPQGVAPRIDAQHADGRVVAIVTDARGEHSELEPRLERNPRAARPIGRRQGIGNHKDQRDAHDETTDAPARQV